VLVEGHKVNADVLEEPWSLTLTGMIDVDLWDAIFRWTQPSCFFEFPYQ
jgi:hypothetical protein